MGNEFGHPEWLDFPREGNGWSYHYCRRQWSLVDNPDLKYHWLADFDRALMDLARTTKLLDTPPAQLIHLDHGPPKSSSPSAPTSSSSSISPSRNSLFDYPIRVPDQATRDLALDTDAPDFGGHGRVDPACRLSGRRRGRHENLQPVAHRAGVCPDLTNKFGAGCDWR